MSNPNASPAQPTPATPGTPAAASSRRRPALLAVAALTVLAGAAYGTHWWLHLRHLESTDNAYVQAPIVQLTPQVGGTVVAVLADDTDAVQAGQPLVRLDPTDARLALERAEAQLGQTVREVRTLYANDAGLASTVRLREAEVARVRAELDRAQADVARRRPLVASGAVGGEEMKHAEAALAAARGTLASAESALAAARDQAAGNRALTDGTRVERHPNVERAAAAVREAWLAVQRTELPAPVAGQVVRRSVQVGQRVAAGAPLLSLVPLDQAWVEANFKEGQLRRMRIGQPVTLTADLYGEKVRYDGRIVGLGAGTGAAFSLLPAQNATGNWIKVVQRVPVRVAIDGRQLAAHPLRVGLSMEATVDVADADGAPLAAIAPNQRTTGSTQALTPPTAEADRLVARIIAENGGRASAGAAAAVARGAADPAERRSKAQAARAVGAVGTASAVTPSPSAAAQAPADAADATRVAASRATATLR